jgi:hypothetical protein
MDFPKLPKSPNPFLIIYNPFLITRYGLRHPRFLTSKTKIPRAAKGGEEIGR